MLIANVLPYRTEEASKWICRHVRKMAGLSPYLEFSNVPVLASTSERTFTTSERSSLTSKSL